LRFRGLLLASLGTAILVLLFTISPRDLAVTISVICIVAAPLAWSIAALLDAAHRPEWVWALAGRARLLWMLLILFGVIVLPMGIVVSGWYLLRIRPELRNTEEGKIRERWGGYRRDGRR
jgi:hypothetical protein